MEGGQVHLKNSGGKGSILNLNTQETSTLSTTLLRDTPIIA